MKNRSSAHCPNFNHRRSNVSIKFCPSCGQPLNADAQGGRCDEAFHAAQRKIRSAFCHKCGRKL